MKPLGAGSVVPGARDTRVAGVCAYSLRDVGIVEIVSDTKQVP